MDLIYLDPTGHLMRREAATGGFYASAWGYHHRLQILTIGELLDGKRLAMPPISQVNVTFKREGRGERGRGEQRELI